MRVELRFIGDRAGYLVDWDSSDRPQGWVKAEVGTTGHRVLVDADKAYVIEQAELDRERRAPTTHLCCVCRDRVSGLNWMQENAREGQSSCRFYFCQTHWDELVVPKGIHWYNGIPVFCVIGMRGDSR